MTRSRIKAWLLDEPFVILQIFLFTFCIYIAKFHCMYMIVSIAIEIAISIRSLTTKEGQRFHASPQGIISDLCHLMHVNSNVNTVSITMYSSH